MAQYRGTLKGYRGEASRLGSKMSGLKVSANGWETGVQVELYYADGKDHVAVWRTAGSNRRHDAVLVAEWVES